jgi:hypothetical protein
MCLAETNFKIWRPMPYSQNAPRYNKFVMKHYKSNHLMQRYHLFSFACIGAFVLLSVAVVASPTSTGTNQHRRRASTPPLFQDAPFLQAVPYPFSNPNTPTSPIRKLVRRDESSIYVLYDTTLFLYSEGAGSQGFQAVDLHAAAGPSVPPVSTSTQISHVISPADGTGLLVLCWPTGCYACHDSTSKCVGTNMSLTGLSAVQAIPHTSRVLVAAGTHVHEFDASAGQFKPLADTSDAVKSLAVSDDGSKMAWGTHTELELADTVNGFRRKWYVSKFVVHEIKGTTSVGAMIDGNITAMSFDGMGSLWVGSDRCINVLLPDRSWRRLDGYHNQLPHANVTSLVYSDLGTQWGGPQMWIATTRGVLRYNYTARFFHCYSSRYYLREAAGRNVSSMLLSSAKGANGAVVSLLVSTTSGGLTRLALESYTLERKAAAFQALVEPRHDRHGLVAPCGLNTFGDLTSWYGVCGDNDGLHTSKYLASQAYRYAVTGDSTVKASAWRHLEALQFLHNVTGDTGFFARTYFKNGGGAHCPFGRGRWYNSTTYPGWTWKGDTSSDEVTGHFFAYNLAESLLATTTQEKEIVQSLVSKTLHWIIKGNYTLVSPETGKPTTWARWDPYYVNVNRTSHDDRGEQSLEILSFMLVGYRMTNNAAFLDAIHELTDQLNQYELNLINSCTQFPADIVHFDHHLVALNHETVIHTLNEMSDEQFAQLPAQLTAHFNASINRIYSFLEDERNTLFAQTFASARLFCDRLQVASGDRGPALSFFDAQDADPLSVLEIALESLRELPLTYIDWPADNTERQDLGRSPYNPSNSNRVVPLNEIPAYTRWSNNPYSLSGGSGMREYSPTQYLTQYWRLRYFGII